MRSGSNSSFNKDALLNAMNENFDGDEETKN